MVGPAPSKSALIDREGALELNDGEPEQDERVPGETLPRDRDRDRGQDRERVRALPLVEGLVTLGSEDAPVCSDGICF